MERGRENEPALFIRQSTRSYRAAMWVNAASIDSSLSTSTRNFSIVLWDASEDRLCNASWAFSRLRPPSRIWYFWLDRQSDLTVSKPIPVFAPGNRLSKAISLSEGHTYR